MIAQIVSLFRAKHRKLVSKFCWQGRDFGEKEKGKNEKESWQRWSRPEREFDARTLVLVVVLISFAYTLRRLDHRREPRKPVLFAQQRLIHRGFLSTSTRREKSIYGTYSHTFPSLFPSSIPQSPDISSFFSSSP